MKIDAASAKELKNVEDRIDAAKIAFDEAKETFGADSPQAEVSKTNIKDLEAERKGILKKQHAERMAKYTTEYDEQKENYNKQLDLLDKTDREIQKATEAGDAITIQSLQKRREAEEKELTAISKYIMTLLEKQHTLAEGSEKAAIEKITDMKKAAEEQFNAWSLARAERTRKTLVDIQKNMLAEQAKNALAFQQLNLVLEKRTEVERLRKEAFESKEADPKKRFALIEKARQASVELYDKLEKVTGGFSKEFREKLDIENIFDLKRQRKDIEASFDALVDKLKVDLKAKFGAEVSGELEGRLKKLQDEVKAVSDSAESIKEAAFGEDLSIEQPSIWEHLVLNSKELKGLITDIKSQILTSMDLDLGGTIGTVGDYQKLAKEDAKKYQSTVKLIQKTTSQLSKHQTALAELKAKEVKEGLSQPERDRQGKLKTAIGHEINIRNILVKRLSEEAKTKATNLDKFVDAILKSGDLNKFKSNEFKSYFAGTPLQDYGTRLAENVQTILELREKLLGATSSAERAEIVAEATKKIIELQTQIKSLGEEPREKTAEEKASERLSAMSPKELVDAIRDNRLDLATFGDSFKITERLLADGNIERTKIVEALDLLVTNWKNPAAAAAGEESIMGGMVLAANGQYMHGRDDIPALLSRGEFVMNAPATRQFFGSIQAMNSAGRNSSVASNITNVGDVNVSLMSSGGETIDAVRIGKAISKEIRRGRL